MLSFRTSCVVSSCLGLFSAILFPFFTGRSKTQERIALSASASLKKKPSARPRTNRRQYKLRRYSLGSTDLPSPILAKKGERSRQKQAKKDFVKTKSPPKAKTRKREAAFTSACRETPKNTNASQGVMCFDPGETCQNLAFPLAAHGLNLPSSFKK